MPSTPSVFVAFGITGDLMRQKILPALFTLHTKGKLAEDFIIIGISRKDWSDAQLQEYVAGTVGRDESFLQRLQFVQGDIEEEELFKTLSEKIASRSAIFYFSLSPALYKPTFEKLVQSILTLRQAQGKSDRIRLMIEKPFGTDGSSAQELNTILHQAFDEKDIYRVDHYLAKESLQTLPPLDATQIQSIHLSFLETVGVEGRGVSYDAVGALRDVGQNHLLEMFATALGGRDRATPLAGLPVLTSAQIASETSHSQYPDYTSIPGVAPDSKTETHFTVTFLWKSIPVTLEGGKHMPQNHKAITVTYKDDTTEEFRMEENKHSTEYKRLIFDCMRGDHTLFVSDEEVALLWRFVDPILKVWYQ